MFDKLLATMLGTLHILLYREQHCITKLGTKFAIEICNPADFYLVRTDKIHVDS
jgi:hypothetical protein